MTRLTSVVLPAPVGPTIATVCPGSATSDRSSISGLSGVVAERHVLELAPARARRGRRRASAGVGHLLVGVEQLEDPLGRGHPGLQQVRHRGHLGQRLGELPGVLDERLHVAQAHRARGHPQAADHGDRDVVEVPDEHHRRHDQAGDELGAEAGARTAPRSSRANAASTSRWRPNTLTSAWPVKASSIWRVERAGVPPLRDELPLRALGDHAAVTSIDSGTVTSAISASSGEIAEHHRQHADHRQQRGEQLAHRLLQGLRDVVDVVGDPAEQLAARLPVEVAQRQPVELVLDVARAAGRRCAARRR